jgi:hypothetical protein
MAAPVATLPADTAAIAAPPNAPIAAPLSVRCSVVVMLAQPLTPSAVAIAMIANLGLMDLPPILPPSDGFVPLNAWLEATTVPTIDWGAACGYQRCSVSIVGASSIGCQTMSHTWEFRATNEVP